MDTSGDIAGDGGDDDEDDEDDSGDASELGKAFERNDDGEEEEERENEAIAAAVAAAVARGGDDAADLRASLAVLARCVERALEVIFDSYFRWLREPVLTRHIISRRALEVNI